MNWPLNAQSNGTFFNRRVFHQELYAKPPRTVNDDIWTFNSQGSSQWDGLRHFGYLKEKVFYNGVTMEDIHGTTKNGTKSTVNGIQGAFLPTTALFPFDRHTEWNPSTPAWAQQGIVGRGILIDYHAWRLTQSSPQHTSFDPFTTTAIPLCDLLACLAFQNTRIHFGDILLIRTGWMAAYETKSPAELKALQGMTPHQFAGLEQSENTLRWIWENFSAVAGDQPSFECWPTQQEWHLHEVLLAGWGCPIGELFRLEKLAESCAAAKRWSFFVTSEPCNVDGGVASPPNILAIF